MPVNLDQRAVKDLSRSERHSLPLGSNAPPEPSFLLTTKDAAQVLGLSPAMLERLRWMREGPPFVRPTGGRLVRYRWRDLMDWIEQHRIDPESARHSLWIESEP